MASQPLQNLTSSHSPLNRHTLTHSLQYIHIVTHTLRPPPPHAQSKERQKRETKTTAAEQNYKTCKCHFSGMPLIRGNLWRLSRPVSEIIKPVTGQGSRPTPHMLGHDHVPLSQAVVPGALLSHCDPRMPCRLTGRRVAALLSSYYKQEMTHDYQTTRKLLHHLPMCLAPSLFRTGGQTWLL